MPVDNTYIYEKKIRFYNRLYRTTLMALATITTFGVIIGVRQVFVTTQRVDQSTLEIKRSMACVVSLFAQPNRTNLTIQDVQNCTLVRK